MEKVSAVKIEIEYTPGQSNGALQVNIQCEDFPDLLIVFASAMRKDSRLRTLVKQSLDFMVSPEFKEIDKQEGL